MDTGQIAEAIVGIVLSAAATVGMIAAWVKRKAPAVIQAATTIEQAAGQVQAIAGEAKAKVAPPATDSQVIAALLDMNNKLLAALLTSSPGAFEKATLSSARATQALMQPNGDPSSLGGASVVPDPDEFVMRMRRDLAAMGYDPELVKQVPGTPEGM